MLLPGSQLLLATGTVGSSPSFHSALLPMHFSLKEPEGQQELRIQSHPPWLCPVLQGTAAVSQTGWNRTSTSLRTSLSACRLQLREKPQITECLGWEGASTRVPWQLENLTGMRTSSSRSSPAQASPGMHKPAPLGLRRCWEQLSQEASEVPGLRNLQF